MNGIQGRPQQDESTTLEAVTITTETKSSNEVESTEPTITKKASLKDKNKVKQNMFHMFMVKTYT